MVVQQNRWVRPIELEMEGMQFAGRRVDGCGLLPIDDIKTYWQINLLTNEKGLFDRL